MEENLGTDCVKCEALRNDEEQSTMNEQKASEGSEAGCQANENIESTLKLEETFATVKAINLQLVDEISNLKGLFKEKILNDMVKEQAFDRLYAELQDYKGDLVFKLMAPVLRNLIKLFDLTESLATSNNTDTKPDSLNIIKNELLQVLYIHGVEPYFSVEEAFNPREHKAIGSVETKDKQLDKTIFRKSKIGFTYGEKIIRPEEVIVYNYKQEV